MNSPTLTTITSSLHLYCPSTPSITPLPFFLPYLIPFLTVLTQYTSNPYHAFLPSILVWLIIPLLDMLLIPTSYHTTLTPTQRRSLSSRPFFKHIILLWTPLHFLHLLWACNHITTLPLTPLSPRLIGFILSLGLMAAGAINVSHELMHRHSGRDYFLAKLLLSSVFYAHFSIEHSRGHHFRVATPADPASFRRDQTFYHFLPRSVFAGFRSACRLEAARLTRRHAPVWGPRNEILQFAVVQLAFLVAVYRLFGSRAVLLVFLQAVMGIVLTEQVNAIEHYGLQRKKLPNGEYERVGPRHSWDAPHTVSNYLLFKLQIHADHHMSAHKPYHALQLTPGSPILPAGYLSLAPLLFIPPLWRRVMDSHLAGYERQWREDDARDALPHSQSKLNT